MKDLGTLKEMLYNELVEISDKGDCLSFGDLETALKLTDIIKDICKIEALEESNRNHTGELETYKRAADILRSI